MSGSDITVFYSWQSDAPPAVNRTFIRQAIERAVDGLAIAGIEESIRVDEGMKDEPGSPEVARVMFEKIENAAVFVADVTLVGKVGGLREDGAVKKVPNPNVAIELGYAAAHLGWKRVVCVMNEFYGTRYEQAFDVRNRRFPIDYNLDSSDMGRADKVKKDLATLTRGAIETCLSEEHKQVRRIVAKLDVECLQVCQVFGGRKYFADIENDDKERERRLQLISPAVFRRAVIRLLELGMLRTDTNGGMYAYHWTYLGREVLMVVVPPSEV